MHVLTDKQAWLAEFTGRLMKWQPCLGDVSIVKFQLDKAEGLLAEALTHDEATMQLANDMEFVVECSRQSERKPAKDAIMVSVYFWLPYIYAPLFCARAGLKETMILSTVALQYLADKVEVIGSHFIGIL